MPTESTGSNWKSTVLGLVSLIVLLVAFGFLFDRFLMPPTRPAFHDPSGFDVLIDSRLSVGIIRLLGIVLGLYVVASLVVLVKERRWMVGFGGLATEALDNNRELNQRLAEAEKELSDMSAEYVRVVDLLKEAVGMLQASGDVPDFSDLGGVEDVE